MSWDDRAARSPGVARRRGGADRRSRRGQSLRRRLRDPARQRAADAAPTRRQRRRPAARPAAAPGPAAAIRRRPGRGRRRRRERDGLADPLGERLRVLLDRARCGAGAGEVQVAAGSGGGAGGGIGRRRPAPRSRRPASSGEHLRPLRPRASATPRSASITPSTSRAYLLLAARARASPPGWASPGATWRGDADAGSERRAGLEGVDRREDEQQAGRARSRARGAPRSCGPAGPPPAAPRSDAAAARASARAARGRPARRGA